MKLRRLCNERTHPPASQPFRVSAKAYLCPHPPLDDDPHELPERPPELLLAPELIIVVTAITANA